MWQREVDYLDCIQEMHALRLGDGLDLWHEGEGGSCENGQAVVSFMGIREESLFGMEGTPLL